MCISIGLHVPASLLAQNSICTMLELFIFLVNTNGSMSSTKFELGQIGAEHNVLCPALAIVYF